MAKNRKSAERQQPVEAHKPDTEPSIGAMETSISAQRLVSGPAVGLVNLGNTCFFNSALQLLLACPDLHEPPRTLCASVGRESAPSDDAASSPAQLALGRGPLGFALQQALLNVNGPPGSKAARHHPAGGKGTPSYNPQALLAAVCRTAPQFKNRQQHDSHELMRLMLDALQEEEKRAAELMTRSSSRKPPTVKDAPSPREPAAEPSSAPQSTPQPAAAADATAVSPSSEAQGDTARAVTPTQPGAGVSGAVFETATAVAAAACSVMGAEAESGGGSSSTTSIPAPTAPAPPSSAPTSNTTTTSQSPSSPPTLSPPSPSLSSSASSSLIAALFGGELLSRITCGDCGHCSQSVESFFDLSLPIPEELPEVDAAGGTKDEGEGGVGRGKDKKGAADKKAGGAKKLSKKEIKQLEKDRKMAAAAAAAAEAAAAAAAVVGKGVGAESAVGKGKGKAGKSKSKGNGRGGDESGDEDAQGAEAGQKGTQEEVQKGPAGQGKGKGKAAAASEVQAGKKLTTKQKRKAEKEERRVKIVAARVAKQAQGGRQDPQDGQDDDDGDRADELPPPPQSEQPAAVEAVVAQQGKKGEEVVSPTSKERLPAVEVQTIPSPDTHSGSQPGSNDASITSLPPTQQPALSADEGPTQSGCCVGMLGDGAATASGGGSDAEAGSGSEAGSGPTAQGRVAEAGKVDVPGAPASSLRAAPVSVTETAAQGDGGLGMAASSEGAQEAAVDIPEGSPPKSSSDGDDGVEVERLLSEDTPPPAPAAQPSPAAVPAPAIPAAAAATAGGGMAARKKKGSSAARAAGSGALGNGAGIEAGTAPSLTAAAAAPVLPVLAARRPVLDVAACLQAFFAAEVVTWACPREKAAAAAAATAAAVEADGVMPAASVSEAMNNLPPTPIRKQVSWSPSMPQVFYVPGSAEQRGTDLEEALRGREPFFRPAKAQGAPFIIQAQLDEWDTDKLHLQVLPLAGSTRAADLLAAAAAAATAAATARGDAAAAAVAAAAGSSPAPMSPVLSTILSSSPRGNGGTSSSYGASVRGKGSPTQSSTGGRTVGCSTAIGQSLPFSELGLPISALDVGVASRVGSFEAARRVQAAAQLAMDCAADLMAGPGGLLHLLDMSAGGFELSEGLPQSPSSPRSHGGSGRMRLLLRGKYPKAPYCTERQNRANRVKGAASSSSQSRGCVGGQTALAQAGGKTGKAEKNSVAAAGPPAAAPGAKEVACQQTSVSASVPIAMSTTRRPRRLNIGSSDEEEEDSDDDDGSRGSGKGARGGTAATWEYPTALRRPAKHPAFAHLCLTTTADDSTISSSSASSASSSASGSPSSSTSPSPSPSPPVSAENSDAEEGATATSAVRRLHHRHGRALAAAVAAAADSFATAVGVTDSGDGDFGGGNSTAAYDNTIAANGGEAAVHLDGAACALGGAGGGSTTAVGDEMAMRQMHGVNLDPAITHHQYHVHHHHHHHHGCSHHHDTQHKHQNPTNQEDRHQQQLQQQQQAVEGEHDKGQRPCLTPEQTLDRVSPHAGGETAVDVGDPLFDMDDLTPPGLSQPPTTHSDGSTTEVPYRPVATAESILSLLAPLPLPKLAKLQSGSNARLDEPSLAMTNSSISAAVAAAANSTFCHPSSSSYSSGALKQQQQPPADMQPASSDGDCDGGGASSSSHSNSGGKHVNASEASTAPAAVSSPSSHSIPIPPTSSPKTTGPQPLPPLALPTEASTPTGPTTTTTAAAAASPSPRALRPLLSPPHAATGGLRGGLRRTPSGVVSVSGAGGVGSYYRASSKQYFLRRAPEVLLLHLKRFAIDNRGRLRKVDKHVGFQTMLDLGPFLAAATTATTNTSPPNVMSPAAVVPADAAAAAAGGAAYLSPFLSGNANVPLSRPDAGVEESAAAQFATDTPAVATDQTPAPSVTSPPARSLLAAAMEPQTGSNTEQQLQGSPSGSSLYVYDLVGLVEHSGEMRYGHYVAYVKRAIPATVAAPSSCSAASSSRNSVDGEGSRNGASGTTTGHSNGSSGHGGGSTAQWYHCSDTTVRPVGEAQVLRAQAYLLLYVRRRSEA